MSSTYSLLGKMHAFLSLRALNFFYQSNLSMESHGSRARFGASRRSFTSKFTREVLCNEPLLSGDLLLTGNTSQKCEAIHPIHYTTIRDLYF